MRALHLLLFLSAPLLGSCEGALGGNIGKPRRAAAAEEGGGESARTRRERARPERTADDEEAGAPGNGAPEDGATGEPVAGGAAPQADAPAPAPTRGGGSRGGRGGRGGGRGGGTGTVEVTVAGSGAGTATVRGTALFEGTPPPRRPIAEGSADAACHVHEVLSEEVVVENGKLANLFVSVRRVPSGVAVPEPPADPYVIDQVGCAYVPHTGAVQLGRTVLAHNSDPTSHNVHTFTSRNVPENRTIAEGGAPLELAFPKADLVRFTCDIHPFMSAQLFVVEHPWFAVSAADGTFTIADLPAGTWELRAEHETLGKADSGEFTVAGGGEVEVTFSFSK